MDVLRDIAEMTKEDYVPQTIVGRRKNDNEDFNPVTVDGEPLKSSEDPKYPGYNWGYGGTGPYLLASSLVVEVFKLKLQNSEIDGKFYFHGAAAGFIEKNFLKCLDMDECFKLTDVEIAKKLYPYLFNKLNKVMNKVS